MNPNKAAGTSEEQLTIQLFNKNDAALILAHRTRDIFMMAYCDKAGVQTMHIPREKLLEMRNEINILLATTEHLACQTGEE